MCLYINNVPFLRRFTPFLPLVRLSLFLFVSLSLFLSYLTRSADQFHQSSRSALTSPRTDATVHLTTCALSSSSSSASSCKKTCNFNPFRIPDAAGCKCLPLLHRRVQSRATNVVVAANKFQRRCFIPLFSSGGSMRSQLRQRRRPSSCAEADTGLRKTEICNSDPPLCAIGYLNWQATRANAVAL